MNEGKKVSPDNPTRDGERPAYILPVLRPDAGGATPLTPSNQPLRGSDVAQPAREPLSFLLVSPRLHTIESRPRSFKLSTTPVNCRRDKTNSD